MTICDGCDGILHSSKNTVTIDTNRHGMVIMMKNVQISQELFVALLHYHLSGENEYEEVIEQGLEQKIGCDAAA